jgi:thymidine kinase
MFSGKTEELIRRVKRAQIARQKVQIFRHRLDTRYGEECIASHSGVTLSALTAADAAGILDAVEDGTRVVAIDEAQFFDWAVADVCTQLADRGVRVIVAGLDMDFRGEPFGPIPLLLAQAEFVTKLEAICMICGAAASRTQRLIDGRPAYYDDPIIHIGASEAYEARCRVHHEVPRRQIE